MSASGPGFDVGAHLGPFAFGACVGLCSLIGLWRAGLRWTWIALALPLVWPIVVVWRPAGLALASATVFGLLVGLQREISDRERAGEEAMRAKEAKGVGRWISGRREHRGIEDSRLVDGEVALGTTRTGGVCSIPFVAPRSGVHGLVIGATGSGKTFTQAAIAETYIGAGLPAIVIDPKSDSDLRTVISESARRAGMAFREWKPSGQSVYNPFACGNPTEIADKALAGQRWSEPHYELAIQRLLGKVLPTMQAAGEWPPTITSIVRYMDPDRLESLASSVGGSVAADVIEYVDSLSKRGLEDLGGGRNRLAVLGEGALGPQLDPNRGKGSPIDLRESLQRGEVVYFDLEADRYPPTSKLLAAALVIDLVTMTADLRGKNLRGLVLIDEFAALAADQVARLFGRARDAGLSLLLGTQSLADLRVADPNNFSDALTEQVFTNVSFSVVHREADPDSAERLAGLGGTEPSWSITKRTQGRFLGGIEIGEGTRTREREFVVLPDEFKRLQVGEAIVVNPTAKPPAQLVNVWMPRIAAELGLGSGGRERPVSSSRGEGSADWHSA